MYTYYTSDLRSIPRKRNGPGRALETRRAFTHTSTGAGIEFPVGRRMPDSDNDEPAMGAVRGGPPARNNAPYERTFKGAIRRRSENIFREKVSGKKKYVRGEKKP